MCSSDSDNTVLSADMKINMNSLTDPKMDLFFQLNLFLSALRNIKLKIELKNVLLNVSEQFYFLPLIFPLENRNFGGI